MDKRIDLSDILYHTYLFKSLFYFLSLRSLSKLITKNSFKTLFTGNIESHMENLLNWGVANSIIISEANS